MTPDAIAAFGALLVTILTVVVGLTFKVTSTLNRIEHQLFPNSGKSLRDRVDRIERQVERIADHLELGDTPDS
jgi:hypothetical protein